MASFWDTLRQTAPEIRVFSKESLLPSSPTPRHDLFLPCLDSLWREIHYNRRLLFYPPPQSPPPASSSEDADRPSCSAIAEQLKKSLSDCLVHYFPWCGRLALDSSPDHRLVIDCNDAGVEFVEASIDMPFSTLAQDGIQMKPFFDELCQRPDHKGDCLYSSPLLSIQVTFFSDGGFALGVAQSHLVADGQALWNFMISWAECSRGLPLSLPPLHDRERLALPEASRERASLWSLALPAKEEPAEAASMAGQDESKSRVEGAAQSVRDRRESADALQGKPSPAELQAEARPPAGGGGGSDPLLQCALELPASAVKALKEEAGGGFSSYEVICAHIWKSTTAARQLDKSGPTYLSVLANCRRRVEPPLPLSYFGNVISFNLITAIAGKICSEALQATAGRVHELVVAVQENLTNMMHHVEVCKSTVIDMIRSAGPIGKGHNVASSPRFPAYEVDFGWGKPAAVRPAKIVGEGEIVFFGGRPGSSQGDVEICLALPSSALKRLLDDPLFLARLLPALQ